MTDIVLGDIGSGYDRSIINNNFTILENVVNNDILHLEGGNNILRQSIDMDDNNIININQLNANEGNFVSKITVGGTDYEVTLQNLVAEAEAARDAAQVSETNAAQSASDAAVSETNASNTLDEFQDQYWGAYATEPALSPVGNPATAGDLYFNTTDALMKVYDAGSMTWINASSSVNGLKEEATFTNVAGQDTFAFTYDPNFVEAFYNGARLVIGVDYDASSGTQVVLTTPVTDADDYVTFVAFNSVEFADFGTAAFADLGTAPTEVPTNADLGTAAYADVQTSPTDATAGALLANGSWGNGDQAPIVSDFNDASTGGKWRANDVASNSPDTGTFFTIEVIEYSSGNVSQVALGIAGSMAGAVYTRYFDNTWSDWQPVYTGANLNPNVFGGVASVPACEAIPRSATSVWLKCPHSLNKNSPSLSLGTGTINIVDNFFVSVGSFSVPSLNIITANNKFVLLEVTGLTGVLQDRPYYAVPTTSGATWELV